ncbi:MAG: hypothetical protein ABIQ18_17210, partial [Umezawaea sp.]
MRYVRGRAAVRRGFCAVVVGALLTSGLSGSVPPRSTGGPLPLGAATSAPEQLSGSADTALAA